MYKCCNCKKELTHDEVGISKKLISMEESAFLCIPCIAKVFGVSEDIIIEKIKQFKKQGCCYF